MLAFARKHTRAAPAESRDIQGKAYLLLNVVEGVGRVNRKANEDDVRVGVGERAKTIVILLTSRIPQG
jgi:hypothetical protein